MSRTAYRTEKELLTLLCKNVLDIYISLAIELLQLVTRYGMFDLDDLMNNSLGALLGWVCYKKWAEE